MNSSVNVLACDVGGGSGRVLLTGFDGDRLGLEQLVRFPNEAVRIGDSLYWDILGIFKGLKDGLVKAWSLGARAAAMGIDTWGNDFAFLDKKGYMTEAPHSYRDSRTEGMVRHVDGIIPAFELYSRNGIQQVRMNTMYQLASLAKERPYVFENADKFLFVPDLLAYFLTGEIHSEYTLSTISQLYHYGKAGWDYELMELLGIPGRLFPPVIQPGTKCGAILPSVCSELGIGSLPLISVGAHDTASAVAAVPEPREQTVYISSGTWSIVGTETDAPVINEAAFRFNFANEGGVGGKIRLVKNVMGLWILQEIRRRLDMEGRRYSFGELASLAEAAEPFGPVIDPDDACFYEPADMLKAVRSYCARTGQKIPGTDGEVVRTVLESLAFKYRYVIAQLEQLSGHSPRCINIIGGGSQNRLLCRMTADCCGRVVYAGPAEATALGNALTQLIALGELADLREARSLVRRSFGPECFEPRESGGWDERYFSFLELTGLSR